MIPQILTESQINQVNHVCNLARRDYNELYEEGERDITLTYTLFDGSITLRLFAFNDYHDGIFRATEAYTGEFGDTFEIFDYNEKDCIDMWGEDGYDYALEEIAEMILHA
jgi:hypothetical protein